MTILAAAFKEKGMYKAYYNGILFYDPRIDELALLNPVVELEENKAGSFSFTIMPENPAYDHIKMRKTVIEVYNDDQLVFAGVPVERTEDFYKQREIYCEGELTYLNDSIQRQAKYQNMTVRGLLEKYINHHNAQVEATKQFRVGMVTVKDNNDSLYRFTNMQSTMMELKEDFVDDLGGFFRIRHVNGVKYIDYLDDSQNTNRQIIKLGKNLIDYSSNIDSSEIATAIIPLGKKLETAAVEGLETRLDIKSVNNGLDYVHSSEAVNEFGWIYKVVEWDDVTEAENLKKKGEQYLSDTQFENMIIEAKAVDLGWTSQEIEHFKLSDKIRVVSKPHGLDRYFRLTKQTLHLDAPEKDTITLGKNEKRTLSARNNQASYAIKKAMESITPVPDIIKQATQNATELITNAMGGFVYKTNNELYIMDTNDPDTATKVWRWNINGLGYSSTGVKGPYGLAMTMDGSIVADYITTGILNAIEINNGNGTFKVTKDGKLTATSGTIAGWNIGPSGIYKDIAVVGTSTVYRVYFQPPINNSSPEKTWVLSCQKSEDSGKTFSGIFVLYADGSAVFGKGNTQINADGSANFCNNTVKIAPSGLICGNVQTTGNMFCDASYVCQGRYGVTTQIKDGNGHILYFTGGIFTGFGADA